MSPEVEFHDALKFTIDADIFARRIKAGLAERRRDAAIAGICQICVELAFHGPRHPSRLVLSRPFGRVRNKDSKERANPLNPHFSASFQRNQCARAALERSEEHTSELQSLMRISYAVFCLKKKKKETTEHGIHHPNIIN